MRRKCFRVTRKVLLCCTFTFLNNKINVYMPACTHSHTHTHTHTHTKGRKAYARTHTKSSGSVINLSELRDSATIRFEAIHVSEYSHTHTHTHTHTHFFFPARKAYINLYTLIQSQTQTKRPTSHLSKCWVQIN